MLKLKKIRVVDCMNSEDENISNDNVREVIVERKVGFSFSEVIIIMIIAIMFGFLLGNIINFTVVDKKSNDKDLKELVSTYNNIIDNYYKDVNKEELIDAGIQGMINYLDDPYATYFSDDASKKFNDELSGTYEGIGIQIRLDGDKVVITDVFDDSPAKDVGLKKNDIILKIDDNSVNGKTLNEVVSMISIKNSKSKVKVTVERDGDQVDFSLSKGKIETPNIVSKMYENNGRKIGYLKIEVFSLNTYKQFNKALKELEKNSIDGLVIDVRDNPGGYLSQVKDVLSLFLSKKQVLYQLQTKNVKEKVYGSRSTIKRKYPVSVIINEESASASEILASAFKESYGSHIIGVNSFGKGTVQSASDLSSGDTIKYTVQKWLTPKGNWINEKGVVPTDRCENVLKEGEVLTDDNDVMLKKAIETVSS